MTSASENLGNENRVNLSLFWCMHEFSCVWQLMWMWFSSSRRPGPSSSTSLCDRVFSVALRHASTPTCRRPCARASAALLSFAHCASRRSTTLTRAENQSEPSPLPRRRSSPAPLEARETSVASERHKGKCYKYFKKKNASGFLTVLKDFLKCFIFQKCELNCAQRWIPTIIPCQKDSTRRLNSLLCFVNVVL